MSSLLQGGCQLIGGYSCLLFPLLILFGGGCGQDQNPSSLRIVGSTTVLPIVAPAADLFKLSHPQARITISAGGSGVGIRAVGNGLADVGMASRDITERERTLFSHVVFRVHLIGRDGVACAISSEIAERGVESLTPEQIAQIYRGKITNWREVGGPDRTILVIDKETHRGTRHAFMRYILNNPLAQTPGADLVVGSNNEELTRLTQSDRAIGLLSHAWLNGEVRGVGLQINGESVSPTTESIQSGDYPIVRDLLLVTNGEPQGLAAKFIDFLLSSEGQDIVEESGYVAAR